MKSGSLKYTVVKVIPSLPRTKVVKKKSSKKANYSVLDPNNMPK